MTANFLFLEYFIWFIYSPHPPSFSSSLHFEWHLRASCLGNFSLKKKKHVENNTIISVQNVLIYIYVYCSWLGDKSSSSRLYCAIIPGFGRGYGRSRHRTDSNWFNSVSRVAPVKCQSLSLTHIRAADVLIWPLYLVGKRDVISIKATPPSHGVDVITQWIILALEPLCWKNDCMYFQYARVWRIYWQIGHIVNISHC